MTWQWHGSVRPPLETTPLSAPELDTPSFESWLWHLLAWLPPLRYLSSLCLSRLISKTEILIVTNSPRGIVGGIKGNNPGEIFSWGSGESTAWLWASPFPSLGLGYPSTTPGACSRPGPTACVFAKNIDSSPQAQILLDRIKLPGRPQTAVPSAYLELKSAHWQIRFRW